MSGSRKLNVQELFDVLQEEYLICKLRQEIYRRDNLKEYWGNVAEGKKEKIMDISKRNHLPCIFDHEGIEAEYKKKVFREKGYPHFYYTSKESREKQEYWDLWSYYHKDTPVNVFFKEGEDPVEGTVVSNDIDKKEVLVRVEKKDYLLSMEVVTRIF